MVKFIVRSALEIKTETELNSLLSHPNPTVKALAEQEQKRRMENFRYSVERQQVRQNRIPT